VGLVELNIALLSIRFEKFYCYSEDLHPEIQSYVAVFFH